MDSNFFILFKMPRTGSSRLGQLMNEHSDCYCYNEILNDCDHNTHAQGLIDGRLRDVDQRNIGFTVYPAKLNLATDFFDPRLHFGDRRLLLFCLTRGNVLEQCVSGYVTKQLKVWPGSRKQQSAKRVLELVDSGLELEEDRFLDEYKHIKRSVREFEKFGRKYARAMNATLHEITYENIYGNDNADLKLLFDELGIGDKIPELDAGEKILPPPESYITNWNEIRSKISRSERHWWSFGR